MRPIVISIDTIDDRNDGCTAEYRFRTKADLRTVFVCLQIPAECGQLPAGGNKTSGGYLPGEALFLFFLERLGHLERRLDDMARKYGGHYTKWSRGFMWLCIFIYQRWSHKLEDNLQFWAPYFPEFAEAIRKKVVLCDFCFLLFCFVLI